VPTSAYSGCNRTLSPIRDNIYYQFFRKLHHMRDMGIYPVSVRDLPEKIEMLQSVLWRDQVRHGIVLTWPQQFERLVLYHLSFGTVDYHR